MNDAMVIDVIQQSVWVAFWVSLPLLGGSLIIGLLIGILQAVTQIHEMTLTFVPKILIVGILLIFIFPWMLNITLDFTIRVFSLINTL